MAVENPGDEFTPGVAWLTVVMGGMLLVGNVAELGGVPQAAKEWTAWLFAGIILVHGVTLGWQWGQQEHGLRLPRWPMLAMTFVVWLGYAWWRDETTPWLSRETFTLAGEAWLLCWVVAVTPGTRALSWAWLMVVVGAAVLALIAAVGCQATRNGLWLPLGRRLPAEWLGHWSGTLPLPATFGALMLLAGPPLLVLACARQLPVMWRILCGSGGFAMLLGAVFSFSLGAWLGVAFALVALPLVVTQDKVMRLFGWWVGIVLIVGWVYFLFHLKGSHESWFAPLETNEPTLGTTWMVIAKIAHSDVLLGGHGESFTVMARAAGVPGPDGGWSYGFSDWGDLAAAWGLLGTALTAVIFGGLLTSGWVGWAKLPRWVSMETANGAKQIYTPEAKVLLGATVSGLSALVVAMTASRTLNVPAVVFAVAIMAGVLARNVPQRGGSFRLEPGVRRSLCLGLSVFVAVMLIWKVAIVAGARQKLDEAQTLSLQTDHTPDAELLVRARAALHEALVDDPNNVPVIINLAWLELEEARLEPDQLELHGNQAEYQALRASNLAPRAPEPWIVRALACWLVNRPKDALAHLNHALELAPGDPMVHYYADALLKGKAGPPVSLAGQPVLPPRFVVPAPWPPLEGLPSGPEPPHP